MAISTPYIVEAEWADFGRFPFWPGPIRLVCAVVCRTADRVGLPALQDGLGDVQVLLPLPVGEEGLGIAYGLGGPCRQGELVGRELARAHDHIVVTPPTTVDPVAYYPGDPCLDVTALPGCLGRDGAGHELVVGQVDPGIVGLNLDSQ